MNPEVFFYEAFAEEATALKEHLPPEIAAAFTAATIQEHGAEAPPAPLVSIRTQSQLPPAWAGQVRGILSRSTGYDHLVAYAGATAGACPELSYLPLYCHRAVAEQAMLLALALWRRLPQQLEQFADFHRDHLTGHEAAGKTALVVGVGHIGYEIVRLARGLDLHALGVDLVQRHDDVTYTDLATGLAQADVVFCAMNLTADNRGYFTGERLRQCRQGALFVNVARGELAPARVLLPLLEAGVLGGVGLDVYDEEPELAVSLRAGVVSRSDEVAATLALHRHPRALLTPHNAFNTAEGVARKAADSIRQVRHFHEHGRFLWPVPGAAVRPV